MREGAPEFDGGIDHLLLFRDDFGAACHAPKVMPGIAVVLFDGEGVCLADHMSPRRKNLGKRFPVVREKDTVFQVLDFVIEPLEGCSITTACNPGNSSP